MDSFSSPSSSTDNLPQETSPNEWPVPPWWFWVLAFLVGCVGILSLSGILLVWYGAQDGAEVVMEEPAATAQVVVEVTGAVKQPGVYSLPSGARWADALAQAGGVLQTADATYLSKQLALAAPVEDGGKLYIPFTSERQASASGTAVQTGESVTGGTAVVSTETEWTTFLNTATETQLDGIDGFGPKTVAAIADNRPFTTWADVLERANLTKSQQEAVTSFIHASKE